MVHPIVDLDPLALLPHRFPFLLVDRMRVVEPGRRAEGTKLVTGSEWSLIGPDANGTLHPMPHLLIVESLAQLSAAVLQALMAGTPGAIGYFLGFDRVRCRGQAIAGDVIDLSIELLQFRRGVCKTRGVARVANREIVRATLTTIMRASPQ